MVIDYIKFNKTQEWWHMMLLALSSTLGYMILIMEFQVQYLKDLLDKTASSQ
jgi:hypothetical protein